MTAPRVSVVMPVRDVAPYLDAAIGSIRQQTLADWELVIVDDGSTDTSAAIAGAHERVDDRIRLLRQDPLGIVTALHRGCAEARGAFIARMDGDDVASSERLARQVALLESDQRLGLCGTHVTTMGDGVRRGRLRYGRWLNGMTTHETLAAQRFIECPIAHPTFMMRREVYETVGGYVDRGWAEDYDLVLRIVHRGYRLGNVAAPLLSWREREGRTSMTDSRYAPECFRAAKRHYLIEAAPWGERTLYQWGVGEEGKHWLRLWPRQIRPAAVVDVNPRKVGTRIHGYPVIGAEALPRPEEAFTVVAVGAPGARPKIRDWFARHNGAEGRDYLFLA